MKSLQDLAKKFQLTKEQEEQFVCYLAKLKEWNERINLTAITSDADIVNYHFADSLYVGSFFDFNAIATMADIGAGAGFPALPLKIKYPHLGVALIEVTSKKVQFLEMMVKELGLEEVEVYPYDWRTFLRKSEYTIDLFVARASLSVSELLRVYGGSSPYKDSQLLYWASQHWQPESEKEASYFEREEWYTIDGKKRKIAFFKNKKA